MLSIKSEEIFISVALTFSLSLRAFSNKPSNGKGCNSLLIKSTSSDALLIESISKTTRNLELGNLIQKNIDRRSHKIQSIKSAIKRIAFIKFRHSTIT